MTHTTQELSAEAVYRWNGQRYEDMSHGDLVTALKEATDIGAQARDYIVTRPDQSLIASLTERLRQAESKLVEMKEAIKPFALCANKWVNEDDALKMEIVWWKPVTAHGPVDFYLSDLRRLSRSALNQAAAPQAYKTGTDAENTNLREALVWALAELRGQTRYDNPQQAINCFAKADDALASAKGAK